MFKVSRKFHFDSAHKLIGYKGKCANMHGHTWFVEVTYKGKRLDELGMLIDFTRIKEVWKELEEQLDHHTLNEIKSIGNPTAENLSQWIYERFQERMFEFEVELASIKVWESPDSYVEYTNE